MVANGRSAVRRLKREMENFIMATQEWGICTSKDRWLKKSLRPEWRLCGQAPDAIHHIISIYYKYQAGQH